MMQQKVKRSARNSMMNMLARRDHSELELRNKLKLKFFDKADIDKAIEFAKHHGWIPDEKVLSQRFSDTLHRKNKGIQKINHSLKQKGLPPIKQDQDMELEKALEILGLKLRSLQNKDLNFEEKTKIKAKAYRLLTNRGFTPSIIKIAWQNFIKSIS